MAANNITPKYSIDDLDLSKYGIDYSAAYRQELADIFRKSATAAYGQAQQDYSNLMSQERASLQDTLRRSQAEAVATGASKGMQAANELSSLLGFQQAAAQNGAQMQRDYAAAMAAADQSALDFQNAQATVGANIAAADVASQAQKYAADISDPYRIFKQYQNAINTGNPQIAEMILRTFAASSGMTSEDINNLIKSWDFSAQANPDLDAIPESGGTAPGTGSASSGNTNPNAMGQGGLSVQTGDFKDQAGKNFFVKIDGKEYRRLELQQNKTIPSEVEKIATNKIGDNQLFVVEDQLYLKKNGKTYAVGDSGVDWDGDGIWEGLFSKDNEYANESVAKLKQILAENYTYDAKGNMIGAGEGYPALLHNFNYETGKNFSATFGGKKYTHLELGTKLGANSDAMKYANSHDIRNQQFFLYNNEVYIKTKEGTWRVGGIGNVGYDSEGKGTGRAQYNALRDALKQAEAAKQNKG